MTKKSYLPDVFTIGLIISVTTASLFPVHGAGLSIFNTLTTCAVGLLFFLHGAKLSREAVLAGASHWRLHSLVMAATFLLFPLLGLLLKPLFGWLLTPELALGLVFLCTLPSTVQSSIAFTSIARGNVPAAICSASASNLIGIFITPLLAGLILSRQGGENVASLAQVLNIVEQILLPFVAGQIARRWIGGWVAGHKALLKITDQSSILLVVYSAFSGAVLQGLWSKTPLDSLLGLLLISLALLALVMGIILFACRLFGFDRADRITILFCGSKKSLVSGIPIANVLFAGHASGAILLPLMLFHQIQLMACSLIAKQLAKQEP